MVRKMSAALYGSTALLLVAQATHAGAQTQAQTPSSESEAESGEIVVTGSRVARDGSAAATPVTVADAEQLTLAAPTNLADSLNQLPAFKGSGRPQTAGFAATGANGGNFLSLRNLSPQRTLILLDGRRIVPTSAIGVPDINVLPQDLVKRVEIVTGGASAVYGSDAVAGVVNFILDKEFKGMKAEAQAGISNLGDGASYKASLTYGTTFADGRGHLLASGQYYDSAAVNDVGSRDWARRRPALVAVAGATPGLIRAENVGMNIASYGGVITSGPLANTQFLPGGISAPFNRGTPSNALFGVGSDGARLEPNIAGGLERITAYGRASYEVADAVTVFAEGALAEAKTTYNQVFPPQLSGSQFRIFADNAFLPADIRARMTALNLASITVGRVSRDFGASTADSRNRTWRGAVGVEGKLGGDWTFDAYYTHGQNRFFVRTGNNPIHRNLYAAADAVLNPATGTIVCRSTLAGLDPGCVPLNIFGEGAPSAAAIVYLAGTASYRMIVKQDVVAGSIQGKPFSTWAGPVSLAAGAEYRKESADQISDPISQQRNDGTGVRGFPAALQGALGGFFLTNAQPIRGSYDIREGFVETAVPLARDMGWADLIEFNGAVRFTDYSTSGSVTTWKAGLTWNMPGGFRVRGTRSRDIRAANIAELFTGSQQTQSVIRLPDGTSRSFLGSRQGNPNLKPEKADTLTAGIVYQPRWLTGFSISADYYDIDIHGAISSLSPLETINQCNAGSAVACANISDVGGTLRIILPNLNLASIATSGVDIETSYRTSLGAGSLALRGLLNYTDTFAVTTPGAPPRDLTGEVGNSANPRWSGTFTASYADGPFTLFAQERFISAGKLNVDFVEGVSIDDNKVPARFYTDVTGQITIGEVPGQFELFATVNNLFDADPPVFNSVVSVTERPTNFALYDVIGRYYTVGARIRF